MDPVLELRGAVARVGQFPVLAGVDLSVARGERVLVQGPNGAGKTSLLRTAAGLLAVTSGTARVLGHDLTVDRRTVRRSVGYLAHATGLYDDLTAADNVRFWAEATRTPTPDADSAMRTVGLATRLWDVPVHRLSTGQRRRVSLASMIVRRPQLWLLDEPHAGLDAAGRDVIDQLILAATEAGATVLFASHDLDRAVSVSSRIVTIVGGTVVHDAA
ncbi:MAG: heme ABC exporter ATP-binding protein CcmA [Actinobacteria bacterium]|nr:heme ABC exporter ATP-binding protein CcmA [Actinomycetota bacterium]